MDELNSWIIVNELGEDIICESTFSNTKSVFIKNGEMQALTFLSLNKENFKEFKEK